MKKKHIIIAAVAAALCIALIITLVCVFGKKDNKSGDENTLPMPSVYGKMVYHSIDSDGKGKIYLYDFDENALSCISDKLDGISDCRDARFNNNGGKIVFSALPDGENSVRCLYIYELSAHKLTQLCPNMAEQQSSPDFSPDGKHVVFSVLNGAASDIMKINVETQEISLLVSDGKINTQPSFSEDGTYVYYTSGEEKGITSICRVGARTGQAEAYYSEQAISCSDPMEFEGLLYFSRWFNAVNTTEIGARYNPRNRSVRNINFNSYSANCSGICPVTDCYAIVSSSREENMGGDLYLLDIYGNGFWSMTELNKKINTDKDELSPDYYIADKSLYELASSVVTMEIPKGEQELTVNQTANFTVDISGGYGKYEYSYYVLKDGKVYMSVPRVFSTLITFTPKEAGNYVLKVYVEDESGHKTVTNYEFSVSTEEIVS